MRDGPGDHHLHVVAEAIRHQHGGSGGVGVDVIGKLLRARIGLEQRERLDRAAVILRHGTLVVADLHLHAGTLADRQRLLDGGEDGVGLVAHMGGVEAVEGLQRLGHRDHLVGRRMHVGLVVEAGGEAGRALGHRLLHAGMHVVDLAVARGR
jgi:hypothetical protein